VRRRDWVSAGFGIAALATAVLALGGAMRWGQGIVALLVAGALVPHLRSRSVHEKLSPLVVILAIAAGLTTLQLVPLPGGLLRQLNASGTTLREDGAALVGVEPWNAISLDAPATLRALAFFFILLGVALVAIRIAASERGRHRLLAAVAGICGLTAVITLGHKLVGADLLFGVYDPRATPAVLGPLLNENHLGGLMAIGTTTAAGLVMHRRQRSWMRAAWLVVMGLCAVVTLLSTSRGATLALIGGMLVVGGVLLAQRFARKDPMRRKTRFMTSSLPLGVVAASAIVIIVYSSAGGLSRELGRTSIQEVHSPTSKFAAWRSAGKLVEEAPWFGVGRGAMETSFTHVHSSSGFATYSHLENEYLQTVVDFGIPGTLLLAACSLWLATFAIRRWRDGALAAAAFGAVTCVLLQSSVDFGVELLGLAVPMTIVVATLAYVPLREGTAPLLLRGRILRIGLVVALCTSAIALFTGATKSLDEDREDLAAHHGTTLAAIEPAITRHPLDYYGYAVAADVMARTGDGRAIKFLNHAMRLHPTHPGLHRVAGRLLFRTGHVDQAAIEYAAAMRYTIDPTKLLAEITATFKPANAVDAIPTDYPYLWGVVGALRDLKQPQIAGIWLSRVIAARPRSTRACELWFDVLLQGADLPLDAGAKCLEMMPDRQTRLALAHAMIKQARYDEAVRLISDVETWPGRIDERAAAWLTLCDVHSLRKNWADAKRCLRRLDASGDLTPDQRPGVQARLEQVEKLRKEEDLAKQPKPADKPKAP
jgi:O-antigen ligase